jgi:hypothetical protein
MNHTIDTRMPAIDAFPLGNGLRRILRAAVAPVHLALDSLQRNASMQERDHSTTSQVRIENLCA